MRLTLRTGRSRRDLVAVAQRALAELDERVVQRLLQAVVLRRACSAGPRRRAARACRRSAAGPGRGSSSGPRLVDVEQVAAADRLRRSSGSRARRGSSRTSCAMNRKKFSTYSGRPSNRSRSSGFWVATPTGQVSRWQTRIMMQPDDHQRRGREAELLGAEQAAMTTSRPVLSWPSVCTTIRSRSPLITSVCWVSARPSSHGDAGVLDRGQRQAPVPPSWPEISTTSRVGLGHARGDRADAELGDQLDVDAGRRVGVLQVVDELLEVLDRVDVVVRRRGDQADARRGVPDLGDPRVDLVRRGAGPPRPAWPPAPS